MRRSTIGRVKSKKEGTFTKLLWKMPPLMVGKRNCASEKGLKGSVVQSTCYKYEKEKKGFG